MGRMGTALARRCRLGSDEPSRPAVGWGMLWGMVAPVASARAHASGWAPGGSALVGVAARNDLPKYWNE